MQIRILLIWFVVVLIRHESKAQIYLNEVFPTIRCSGILLDSNNGYIVNGWVVRPDSISLVHRDLILYRIDSNGQKLDSLVVFNSYTDGFSAFAGSLKRLSNGDILQLGYIGDNGNIDSAFGGIIYRVFSNLSDSIWSKKYQYNDLNFTINYDAIELLSGNIVVAGQYFHSYNTGINNYVGRGWLYMLDANGNRLWEKSINYPGYIGGGQLRDIKRAYDGGFILGGGAYSGPWNSVDGWVIKTDSLGNEQWRHKMTTGSQWYDSEPIIVPTSDGNYVVGQLVAFQNYNGTLFSARSRLHFKKLTPQGTVIWEKEYGDTSLVTTPFVAEQPYRLAPFLPKEGFELEDNSIVFGGSNAGFSGVFKISASGDSIWYRRIFDRENNIVNTVYMALEETARMEDFKPLPGGGFICAGQYETSSGPVYFNGAQLNWIVQLDEWGCDSLGCQFISLPEPPPPDDSFAMRIWPNPASNELYVEIPAHHMGLLITIRNALGQSVYQAFHSNRPIDISQLPPGVYTVESGLPGQLFGYAKLVKR